MKEYVNFICDRIPSEFGASLYKTMRTLPGTTYKFPYKNIGIPVKVVSIERLTRSAIFEVESLGHRKSVHVYMSRLKGPEILFSEVQEKIDDAVNDIIKENNMDVEELRSSHDEMLKFIKTRTVA
jgi:Asp-tRNA(Asn)/Glu-tRNA(Gln) amidotransferase B subunit